MRRWQPILSSLVLLVCGCGIHAVKKPERVASRQFFESQAARRGEPDPASAARALEAGLPEACDAESLTELAAMCFQAAHRESEEAARPWYRDAAVYSAFAIGRGAGGATYCRAEDIHNRSVENLIRLAQQRPINQGCPWQSTFEELGITLIGTPFLAPNRFTALEIAHDYRLRGVQAEYRNDGIGVPLVAYRHNDREQPVEPMDRYYSFEVNAAATAVIHPGGTVADWRNHPVTLTLYDPFETRTAQFQSPRCAGDDSDTMTGRSVTLATDRTTPLTVQEQFSSLEVLRRVGVFRPDAVMRSERGLYMYQPYRPGKIPVVLVHGIYSSPSTWRQTVNHLQNDPILSERYQVWLFLYPTGAPLTASASELRKALRDAIAFFDPCGNDPALQQMVLVGHSMGGLISKMAVIDSGDALWRAYFDKPFDEVRAAPEVKERLEETLFLTPEPYVQRLVMISAPHRGSVEACFFPGPLLQIAIHRPKELRDTIRNIARENGRGVAAPGVRTRMLNGVGGLSPHDPALNALLDLPIAVPFHSIIPQIHFLGHDLYTDGIVGYWSSHLDGAESEKLTAGIHGSHDSWDVSQEVRRILCEHLQAVDQARGAPITSIPPAQTVPQFPSSR